MQKSVLLIDLDNCLYNAKEETELIATLEDRITTWLQNQTGKNEELAEVYKQELYTQYGGAPMCFVEASLVHSHDDLAQCIDYINGFQVGKMKLNNGLNDFLMNFKKEKYVFTSSPKHYANQILEKLQIKDYFDGLIDIHTTGLRFKNNPETYSIVSDIVSVPLSDCVFIDDGLQNLRTAQSCGMGKCILMTHGEPYHSGFPTINSLSELIEIM